MLWIVGNTLLQEPVQGNATVDAPVESRRLRLVERLLLPFGKVPAELLEDLERLMP